jgi:hypothetical protein
VVEGLSFRDGALAGGAVVRFASDHGRLTDSAIVDYNPPAASAADYHWVLFEGSDNRIDASYFSGKTNARPMVSNRPGARRNRVEASHFRDFAFHDANGRETIQIMGYGMSEELGADGALFTLEGNLFERTHGEGMEIVSIKSNRNVIRGNTFVGTKGGITNRSGNFNTIEGNVILGEYEPRSYGIRVTGQGHRVTGNVVKDVDGACLLLVAGEYIDRALTPDWQPLARESTPLGRVPRYAHVKDGEFADNTFVNCGSPAIEVGSSYRAGWPQSQRILVPEGNRIVRNVVRRPRGVSILKTAADPKPPLDIFLFRPNVYDGTRVENADGTDAGVRRLTPADVGPAWMKRADRVRQLQRTEPVRGWTILSDSMPDALAVIDAARGYGINHLQLSHDLVHNLRDLRDAGKRAAVRKLVAAAHQAGIGEVVLWDHALYDLSYYPDEFRTGPDRTLDLDNPAFWAWLKEDYRKLLDLVPQADGIVLTFIETGGRAERQHSAKLPTPQDKLAAVVNAVADVVIGERKKTLYARTFSYTHAEYGNITAAIAKFARADVRLMMKETPHDFFLTHPDDFLAGTIARPTIIEFDIGAEFNGQGLIANTWPEHILSRARNLLPRRHVAGYVARTDRYGGTRVIGRPSEINLLALKRYVEDPQVTAEDVYGDFITRHYGGAARPFVKAAFRNAFDIVTSTLYTLGTNTANHSKLDYDPYASSYARHVSGKWLDPPIVFVRHDVNRELHYWKDVVDRLAPPWAKTSRGMPQLREVPWVTEREWLQPGDRIDGPTLDYINREKMFGVRLAQESLRSLERGRQTMSEETYRDLQHYFERTELTARLHRAVAVSYFGFRLYARGPAFHTPGFLDTVRQALDEIPDLARAIREYPAKPPAGQWNWVGDADAAIRYHEQITHTGWPKESHGVPNPYAGVTFPTK